MNEDYEKALTIFKENVKEHEKAVVNGIFLMDSIDDYIKLYRGVDIMLSQAQNNFKKKDIKEEIIYLETLKDLLDALNIYHKNNDVVDSDILRKEYKDVRSILFFNCLQRNIKELKEYNEYYPSAENEQMLKEFMSQRDKMIKVANKALDSIMARVDHIDGLKDSNVVNNSSALLLSEKEFLSLNVEEQINCLENIISNIEDKSESLYLHYSAMLNNLKSKQQEEEEKLLFIKGVEGLIPSTCENYWELMNAKTRLEAKIMEIISKTGEEKYSKIPKVSINDNGKKITILNSDLDYYHKIYDKLQIVQFRLDEMMKKEEIADDASLKEKTVEERKSEIIEKINFLKQAGVEGEELDKHIIGLINELRRVEKRRRFTSTASLYRLFKKLGFEKNEAEYYSKITYDPSYLAKSKDISDKDKVGIFTRIKKALIISDDLDFKLDAEDFELDESEKIISSEPIKEESDLPLKEKIGDKLMEFTSSAYDALYKKTLDIKSVSSKAIVGISKALKSIPEKSKGLVSKINNFRKNKMKIKSEVQKRARRIVYTVGLTAVLSYCALANSKESVKETNDLVEENNEILNSVNNSISATNAGVISAVGDHLDEAIYSTQKSEYEKRAEQIGEKVYNIKLNDTFTIKDNANIYENEYDAALRENGKSPYFDKTTKRNVESIIYEYNGAKILLDENDPDFEATKQALESNGAVPVAVGSENEYSVGYEGFYNIDDVNIEGRGR